MYERQPSGICTECYVIKHFKAACKDVKKIMEKAHESLYFFGKMNNVRKNIVIKSTGNVPISKKNNKAMVKTTILYLLKIVFPCIKLDFLLKKS